MLGRVVLAAAEDVFAGHLGLGDKVGNTGFELIATDFDGDRTMLAGDETDLNGRTGGERVLIALYGQLVEVAIEGIELVARLGAELITDELQQGVIEILAAELLDPILVEDGDIVAMGLDESHVEGTAAEVVDQILTVESGIGRVVEGGRGRLFDEVFHLQAGTGGGVFSSLALLVAVVSGPSDDHTLRLAELFGVVGDHLLEKQGAQLDRGDRVCADGPGLIGTHLPLEFREDVGRAGTEEFLGLGADDHVVSINNLDDRRGDRISFGVVGDLWLAGFVEAGDEGGGGTEIDTDDIGGFVGHGGQLVGVEGADSGAGAGGG